MATRSSPEPMTEILAMTVTGTSSPEGSTRSVTSTGRSLAFGSSPSRTCSFRVPGGVLLFEVIFNHK